MTSMLEFCLTLLACVVRGIGPCEDPAPLMGMWGKRLEIAIGEWLGNSN